MIKLKEVHQAWGYSEKTLKESEDLHDILVTLLINCRQYYGIVGMDFPSLNIIVNDKELRLNCGMAFRRLDNDEKVIKYVTKWYKSVTN